jgi:sugar phosphate isomerase/epimerase
MHLADVGVCLDTGHANLSGDLNSVVRKLGQNIRMVHAHDNRRRGDEHLPPGTGDIDCNSLLAELDYVRFRGALILELGSLGTIPFLMAEARKSKRLIRDISRRLALLHRGPGTSEAGEPARIVARG